MRVAVVDDQTIVREGLASLLGLVPDVVVVGKAPDGREAIALVAEHRPDVVLMDVKMPGMNGVAATREICARFPPTRVIILTTFDDDEYVYEALRAGAAGYLLKSADVDHLAMSIRAVHSGQSVLDPGVTHKIIRRLMAVGDGLASDPGPTEALTDRELEVLRLIADGLDNGQMAERLCLAEGTVRNHVSHVLDKLEARDRVHAVRLGVEWGS
ncbi:MAG: response regulator transcription factor [Chloroflexi bacterium]|nr:response regulator transcription factor [Chloroflexota bacterium]